MQANGFVSKPILLILIGLILGASLGLGSGYAIFYPELVNQRNRTVEERITDLEGDIDDVTARMEEMNSSLGSISDSLQAIVTLSEAITSLNTRLGRTEIDVNSLESEVNQIGGDVRAVEERVEELREEWTDTVQSYDDIQTSIESLDSQLKASVDSINSRLQALETRLDAEDAVNRFKALQANPAADVVQGITDKMFTAMKSDQVFKDWVVMFGEVPAKNLLKQEIMKRTGGFVWNKVSTQKLGATVYLVRTETYFRFEFSPASVTVPKMRMLMRGNVDVKTGEIIQIQVESVEIL